MKNIIWISIYLLVLGLCSALADEPQTLVVGELHYVGSGMHPESLNGPQDNNLTVKILCLDNKTVYTSQSHSNGLVVFQDLPPGNYELFQFSAEIVRVSGRTTNTFNVDYSPNHHDWLFSVDGHQVTNLGKILWTCTVTGTIESQTAGRDTNTTKATTQNHWANGGFDETKQAFQRTFPDSERISSKWVACPLSPISPAALAPVPVSSLNLNRSLIQFDVGGSPFRLTATNATSTPVSQFFWESSDPSVATVGAAGQVTGVSVGTALVSAVTPDGAKVSCLVVVWQRDSAGTYRFFSKKPLDKEWTLFHLPTPQAPVSLDSQFLTVTVKKVSGNADTPFGILFCYQNNKNYYQWELTGTGKYRFNKVVNGKVQELVPWTASPGINPGSPEYVLTVSRAASGGVGLSVNQTALPPVSDSTFSTGTCAFLVDSGTPAANLSENSPVVPEELCFSSPTTGANRP